MVRQVFFRFILASVLLHFCAAAASGVSDQDVRDKIPRLVEQFSRLSGIDVPELQAEDIETLIARKSIVTGSGESNLDDGAEAMGLLGLQLVDAPRLLVWLTILGGGGRSDGRLTSVVLTREQAGAYSRYQHVNLPWPLRDRHWVIYCEKNLDLAQASAGVIWEHRWSLHETGERLLRTAFADSRIPGLDMRTLDHSIYLPANRGTWAAIDLGHDKTLVLAFYDSDLGGRLPAGLVRSFTKRQLRKYLEATGTLAEHILEHYDGNSPIHDGFGWPISRQDAIDVVRAWGKL